MLHLLKLSAILFLGLFTSAYAEESDEVLRAKWIEAAALRVAVLEEHHNLSFYGECSPKVEFGIPPDRVGEDPENFNAFYSPPTNTLFIPPHMKSIPIPENIGADIYEERDYRAAQDEVTAREIIDHELGHCLPEVISRRIGNDSWWPSEEEVLALPLEERIALMVLSEGIATYFEATSTGVTAKNAPVWFPSSQYDRAWLLGMQINNIVGEWLVHPLIEQYGEVGIQYIITNPLPPIENFDLRSQVIAYQKNALEELSKQK